MMNEGIPEVNPSEKDITALWPFTTIIKLNDIDHGNSNSNEPAVKSKQSIVIILLQPGK